MKRNSGCHCLAPWSLTFLSQIAINVRLHATARGITNFLFVSVLAACVSTTGQARGIFRPLKQSPVSTNKREEFVNHVRLREWEENAMEKNTAYRRLRRTSVILSVSFLLSISVSAHPGSGIAVDRTGQVYFLDTGSGLWKIDTRGKLTHLSRTLFHWLAIDANDCFANSRLPSGSLGDILRVGNNPTLLLSSDYPIAIGQDGNLYYPSRGSKGQTRIMRLLPSGGTSLLTTLAVAEINGITAGPDNSIYYTENNSIRRINAQGRISTLATIPALVGGPSIPGNTEHPYLRGLAIDLSGLIYVADSGDARVLKIAPDERVSTVVQLQSPWSPTAVAVFGSDVYALEFLHTARDVRRDWSPRVRKIASDGTSTIIATLDQMPGAR